MSKEYDTLTSGEEDCCNIRYQAEDGTLFKTQGKCTEHNEKPRLYIVKMHTSNYNRYLNTSVERLISIHLTEKSAENHVKYLNKNMVKLDSSINDKYITERIFLKNYTFHEKKKRKYIIEKESINNNDSIWIKIKNFILYRNNND